MTNTNRSGKFLNEFEKLTHSKDIERKDKIYRIRNKIKDALKLDNTITPILNENSDLKNKIKDLNQQIDDAVNEQNELIENSNMNYDEWLKELRETIKDLRKKLQS